MQNQADCCSIEKRHLRLEQRLPEFNTAVSSRNAVWEREYRYLVSDSDLGTEMSMLDHVIV